MSELISINTNKISATIKVPTSKSYANRVLVLGSLFAGEVTVENLPGSSDVTKMLEILAAIGLDLSIIGDKVTIKNSFPACEKDNLTIDSGDGGTTNRFLAGMLALGQKEYRLKTTHKMQTRPMEELFEPLRKLSVKAQRDNEGVILIQGPIKPVEKISVDCKDSTQFATSLTMALGQTTTQIEYKDLSASKAYFELTLDLIEKFKAGQRLFITPIDFSGASYPLAYGVFCDNPIVLSNCFGLDETQADCLFIRYLTEIGVKITFGSEGLKLHVENRDQLQGMDIDGSLSPDLVPTLAFLCSYLPQESKLRNLGILRHKESDRVEETLRILNLFEIPYQYDVSTETLVIKGNSPKVEKKHYDAPSDHRMIMVATLFMKLNNGGTISNFNHVKKSFPNFFEIFNS